jgi:NAD/NADP transhydrogenase beta subunit
VTAFDDTVALVYLGAATTFVLGLHLMNSPASARKGNRLSAAGMAVAIATVMPAALSRFPLRALAGEFMRCRPSTKVTAAAR